MPENLQLALIQTYVQWENIQENLAHFEYKIRSLNTQVDVIILPEMFSTGFTMKPENVAETMSGKTVSWMKEMAQKTNAAIVGSVVIKSHDNFYNRLIFATPQGNLHCYDKRHGFSLAGEDKIYTSGNQLQIITYKGWKICPLICYDLRFPVWSRNVNNYDVLLYVANWPVPRIHAWDTLLKARAIENISYSVGVNRVGFDENEYEFCGHSAVYDELGNTIIFSKDDTILYATLAYDKLHATRKKMQFLNDKDEFTLT
ncbi:amidohydrolase [Zhouia sp. PK063]|uniref:amidohydrolase n=1 Tax=Zhouia sp. PK063 TaxID=3373602 RepID=UPI0037B084E9